MDQHSAMHQCFALPFALLFYFFAERGHLSLTHRHLCVSMAGCILAVVTMGIYSLLLFASAFNVVLLLACVDHRNIHAWVFGVQMLWQTFWHLQMQYRQLWLQEPVSVRLFQSVSSLMLLTQRVTSLSLDVQEGRVTLIDSSKGRRRIALLPLVSYILSFTTLLGGPLCSYRHFLSHVEGIGLRPARRPLAAVSLKLTQVFLLELLRVCILYFMKGNMDAPPRSAFLCMLWVWGLALVLRVRYYAHWRISECLNNAAGFGLRAAPPGEASGLSDGDIWTTEASSRISQFARRWNGTTAAWLRRMVYVRSKRFPLFMTFGFSVWWHGLHPAQCVAFLTWAATVEADRHIDRFLYPKLSSTWQKTLYAGFCWINTQMIVTCVVIAVEFRSVSSLRLLSVTYVGLFPLCNIALLVILSTLHTARSNRHLAVGQKLHRSMTHVGTRSLGEDPVQMTGSMSKVSSSKGSTTTTRN